MPATQSKSRKSRQPVVRDRVLKSLAQQKIGTTVTLGVSTGHLRVIEDLGFIQSAGHVKSGKRGRPAVEFKLTSKGRGRVRTLANRAA